ncbi:MAG TPA: hypothetical protein VJN95_02505 [Gemmatimonadales bacterium]|nr:hypothetical protein [Gemmatimonadales bacterium]
MRTEIRLKMDMATRVLGFCRAHPDSGQSWTDTMTLFEQQMARADALLVRQSKGLVDGQVATASKHSLRDQLIAEPLAHLARIAKGASHEVPGVAKQFKTPSRRMSDRAFLTEALRLAAEAESNKELFLRYGMAATFLDELKTDIDRYEATVMNVSASNAAHVGATNDLEMITLELRQTILKLDAMIRYRFRGQGDVITGWNSVRSIAWPAGSEVAAPAKPEEPKAGEKAA